MRLINSTSHMLEEFLDDIPSYAILSHTWEKEEVSFQDLQSGQTSYKEKPGYKKIENCCMQAERDGFRHVWIDTCCIDKTSSAELSEAINSMYRWYKEAEVCYAYLADVSTQEEPESAASEFAKSRWFTRGWTLQELIAPSCVEFYTKDWLEIGTKLSLQKSLSVVTGIPITALKFGHLESFSIAQRMSWASKRQTTRLEDEAYCLMGLFDVNMPMLYGEGEQAFGRLQEEIMKISDDHSIFAWTAINYQSYWATRGLLAHSPAEFVDAGDISRSDPILKSSPYSITNTGLRIELPLFPMDNQVYFVVLNC